MNNDLGSCYLRDRHAIVTGGGRGLGASIASTLAQLGANVTLMARTTEAVEQQAIHLRATFDVAAFGISCDVTDADAVSSAFTRASEQLGPAYILVNNAGQGRSAPFLDTTLEMWQHILDVNLTGPFRCTQQVLPAMLEARSGRIINIASTAALRGYNTMSAYCTSKHGLIGLTRTLARETARAGVTVNAVCPGFVDTDMYHLAVNNLITTRGMTEEEARKALLRDNPRGMLTTAEEVANTVAWLCSPEASAITGQSIAVAGGEVM